MENEHLKTIQFLKCLQREADEATRQPLSMGYEERQYRPQPRGSIQLYSSMVFKIRAGVECVPEKAFSGLDFDGDLSILLSELQTGVTGHGAKEQAARVADAMVRYNGAVVSEWPMQARTYFAVAMGYLHALEAHLEAQRRVDAVRYEFKGILPGVAF